MDINLTVAGQRHEIRGAQGKVRNKRHWVPQSCGGVSSGYGQFTGLVEIGDLLPTGLYERCLVEIIEDGQVVHSQWCAGFVQLNNFQF